jgi:predicted transcriptional regulator of viral defense system
MSEAGHITGLTVPQDAQLAAIVASQHGVADLPQIVELGLSASGVRKRAKAGRLHRVHRGVYSLVPPALLSWRGRFLAAVLACGPQALLSHRSAAALHDLHATDRDQIDVTVPGRTKRIHDGIDVHRSTTLTSTDTTVVDGIRCTTVARTLLDLAGVARPGQAERALNQAEALRRLDYGALVDQLERNASTTAAANLRAALELYQPGAAPTESRLEQDFVALVRAAGVPEPERQVWFTFDDGGAPFRADFVSRAQRVVLETDGRRYHGTRHAFENDRRRDQRLVRARWQVVRVTSRQMRHHPASVVDLVADLLR